MIDATMEIQVMAELDWNEPPKDAAETRERSELQVFLDQFMARHARDLEEVIGNCSGDMTVEETVQMLLDSEPDRAEGGT